MSNSQNAGNDDLSSDEEFLIIVNATVTSTVATLYAMLMSYFFFICYMSSSSDEDDDHSQANQTAKDYRYRRTFLDHEDQAIGNTARIATDIKVETKSPHVLAFDDVNLEPFSTSPFQHPQQERFHSQQSDAISRLPSVDSTSSTSKRKKKINCEKEGWRKECMKKVDEGFEVVQKGIKNLNSTCQSILQLKWRASNERKRDLLYDELKHMNLNSTMFRVAWQYLTEDDNRIYLFLKMDLEERQEWLAEILST